MTSLVDQARNTTGREAPQPGTRVDGLRRAVEACRGRVAEAVVEEAAATADRVESRLRLSADHTVVALAGATGSGKSSTFNALAGLDLAAIGVRRPTTSWTMSCSWGAQAGGSEELLDWLGVPQRHRVSRNSLLDGAAEEERELAGLVLLDLPDHDSTEVAHHVEVNRLVGMADLLVWVLDPQKYADAALHDTYLRPLAGHSDILLFVLNHIDEVPEQHRPVMLEDLHRLLKDDGFDDVRVIAASARYGEGIVELKEQISARVKDKRAVTDRCVADLKEAARRLHEASEAGAVDVAPRTDPSPAEEVVAAVADSIGLPTVVQAVEEGVRRRAQEATGWPVTSWLSRLRPDPLRGLHMDPSDRSRRLGARPRTTATELTGVQRARVDAVVRAVADREARGLPRPWAEAVRTASVSRLPDLAVALDRSLRAVDLKARTPLWCRAVQLVQWLLLASALCGAGWMIGLGASSAMEAPAWRGLPLPAIMLAGGVVLGIGLGLVCRGLVRVTARLRGAAARLRLRATVTEVTERLLMAPMRDELAAYRAARQGLADVLR